MKKPNEKPKTTPRTVPTKTNHKTGYHKPIKNPTTNAAPDSHKLFCKRCMAYNRACPLTGRGPSKSCSV